MNSLCLITLAAAMPLSVSAGQQAAGFSPIPAKAAPPAPAAASPAAASPAAASPAATSPADTSPEQAESTERTVTPPKVTCRGNSITISAKYSRLGAILTEIQRCTGVQFDAPEDAKMSLIFDEIGPGTSADVVASLLNSSGYDFVIGASTSDPEKIEKVILLARTGDKGPGVNSASTDGREASTVRRAFDQMRDTARPKSPEEQRARMEAAQAEADSDNSPSAGENSNAAAPADAAAAAPAPAEAPPTPAADDGAPKPSSPVADKIADMQKLFEQRRQMIQQTQPQPPAQTQQQAQPKDQQPQ